MLQATHCRRTWPGSRTDAVRVARVGFFSLKPLHQRHGKNHSHATHRNSRRRQVATRENGLLQETLAFRLSPQLPLLHLELSEIFAVGQRSIDPTRLSAAPSRPCLT